MKKQINWSSKNDNFNQEELDFILALLSDLDPLTKGPWLEKFQSKFQKYIGSKDNSCFGLTSAASKSEGPGDFQVNFLNKLNNINEKEIIDNLKITSV